MDPSPLRVVSYNVRYFGHALRGLASTRYSKQAIALRLSELSPLADVICLQEVETRSLRSQAALSEVERPHETQLEDFMAEFETVFAALGREFPYEAFYFRAHEYALTRELPLYTTGLAVLVRSDRLEVEGHNSHAPHPITFHHVEALRDTKQSRICAHLAATDGAGRRLHLFNTHLSLPSPFHRGFWARREKMGYGPNQLREAEALLAFIRDRSAGEPFVLCGDFNSAPGSPVFEYLLESGLRSAQLALGQVNLATPLAFPTAGFLHLRMHLDHLFSGGPVTWLDLEDTHPFDSKENRFRGLSDHVPLVGRFALTS
jgi:endonuclease/exonuclease/phosphatase family metal-dependent hydrolase